MDRQVLVVGGGIAGVQASLDLAEMGIPVTLVEEKPSIGGRMAQLDKTFPTNDCSTCILSPKLVELSAHPMVTLRAYATVEEAVKTDRGFEVRIRSRARYVDQDKCTACGLCAEKCPVRIPDLFNKEIGAVKCIGIPYAQAVPAVYRIDPAHCLYLTKGKCGVCSKVCPAGAVDYAQQDTVETGCFDSLILAAGCEEYTPRIRPEFGYGVYPNVVTSIEYERLLSASGPTEGQIRRPSDGREPRRVAFVQCVGSRDPAAADRGYCSSYCCMQATKDAVITREHLPGSEASIFYIDLRAFGKDFDKFVDRAREEYGVRYLKSRVAEVAEDPGSGNLVVRHLTAEGAVEAESFDLVVLSVGIAVPEAVQELLASLGVRTDAYGFCRGGSRAAEGAAAAAGGGGVGDDGPASSDEFAPVDTNVPGVYVCGTLTGPMDIPETVVSAGAAAARAARGLLEGAGDPAGDTAAENPETGVPAAAAAPEAQGTTPGDTAAERGVVDAAPVALEAPVAPSGLQARPSLDAWAAPLRIGVVVCRCGVNIASVVDVPVVVERSRRLANVAFAEEMTYACSQDSIQTMIDKVRELGLTRFVVASCSPRTHEPLFRGALEKAGLNKYLLQMSNIRDQCSWVHRDHPQEATDKAADLVRMAVARARFLQPLEELESPVNKACLVVGGGLAGMTAALAVADNGFTVHLVERELELGGNLRRVYSTLDTADVPVLLERLAERIREHPRIELYLGTRLEGVNGYVGSFRSTLTAGYAPGEEAEVGAAAGGDAHSPPAGSSPTGAGGADHPGQAHLEADHGAPRSGAQQPGGPELIVEHGAVIVATGAEEHRSGSYGYGRDPLVVSQREFEHMLQRRHPLMSRLESVVMIQCVDSREGDHNYCSRVCCGEAVKNALRFKRAFPHRQLVVLYRDVRTYGLLETHYRKAREAGVLFLPYSAERKPAVQKDQRGELLVRVYDEILGREILLPAQLLVLSVGIDAPGDNRELARMLKVPLNEDGFFLEAHVKLRPVDFATEGVYLCGLAHGPKYARESVTQALAAAGRALTVLSRERISAAGTTARVLDGRCSGCGLCVEVCPYGAIEIAAAGRAAGAAGPGPGEGGTAAVNALLCKGCGSCAATCFSGAIDLAGFTNRQLVREFEELLVR